MTTRKKMAPHPQISQISQIMQIMQMSFNR